MKITKSFKIQKKKMKMNKNKMKMMMMKDKKKRKMETIMSQMKRMKWRVLMIRIVLILRV
jgi:hypothetical protein